MTITIETSEFVETKDGGYFEHHTREEEFMCCMRFSFLSGM